MDCYNESEEVTGLYTMIEEYLAVPFQTSVLGMDVTVGTVDLTDAEEVVVVCRREGRATPPGRRGVGGSPRGAGGPCRLHQRDRDDPLPGGEAPPH